LSDQSCPLCGAGAAKSKGQPPALCSDCVGRALALNGRPIYFRSPWEADGYEAVYADTGEPYFDHACIVRGVLCRAEARLGRIVIRPTGNGL